MTRSFSSRPYRLAHSKELALTSPVKRSSIGTGMPYSHGELCRLYLTANHRGRHIRFSTRLSQRSPFRLIGVSNVSSEGLGINALATRRGTERLLRSPSCIIATQARL